MGSGHERFEAMAVGHVLGGLPVGEAADFRAHLVGCRDCRMRVAELRDIASDLAAAEREERAQARLKTEVARRAEPEDDHDERPTWAPRRRRLVAGVAGLALALLVLFWNLHLRTTNTELVRSGELQRQALTVIATGRDVPLTVADGDVTGVVATDGDWVALSLAGLPEPTAEQFLVVWLVGPDERQPWLQPFAAPQLTDARLSLAAQRAGATDLVISLEPVTRFTVGAEAPTGPGDDVVVEADLREP